MKKATQDFFDKLRAEFFKIATKREKDLYLSLMDVDEIGEAIKHMQKTVRNFKHTLKKN